MNLYLFGVSFFVAGFQVCCAYPIDLDVESTKWATLTPILAVALCASAFVFLLGCLCCRQDKGFQEFTDSTSNHSVTTGGFVNPAATSNEFTIFPPPINNVSVPSCGSIGNHSSDGTVCFEPLPDIKPRPPRIARSSSLQQKRPASFNNVVSHGLSAQDWFSDPLANFPRNQLKYVRELGSGWFGRVVEGEAQGIISREVTSNVVVKILHEDATPTDQMYFLHEVKHYRDLRHPNILRMVGRCLETDPFLVLLEACPSGDLKTFLTHNIPTAEALSQQGVTLLMGCNIAAGLQHMHDKGFVHTDLAARNCLVTPDLSVKIGDYGTSIEIFKDDYYCAVDVALPIRWCAPETLYCTETTIETKEVTQSANVWSFGILLWEICEFGKLPYLELSDEEVIVKVLGERSHQLGPPTFPCLHKQHMYHLMKLCWNHSSNRPTVGQVGSMLSHLHLYRDQDTSISDFEARWQTLKPNSVPISDNLVMEKSQHQDDIRDFVRDLTPSPHPSLGGEFFLAAQKSPSLQNLRGSLDDLANWSDSKHREGDTSLPAESFSESKDYSESTASEVADKEECSVKDSSEKDTEFEAWLKGADSLDDDEEAKFVKKISEAIKDLDDALAQEKTSSSESGSSHQSPSKTVPQTEQNVVLDFRLGTADSLLSRPLSMKGPVSFQLDSLQDSLQEYRSGDFNNERYNLVDSGTDTDDELWRKRIEKQEFSEKVKEKSKSVQDLMVLTHIDYSDLSDTESLGNRSSNRNSLAFSSESNIHGAVLGQDFLSTLEKLQAEQKNSKSKNDCYSDVCLKTSMVLNENSGLLRSASSGSESDSEGSGTREPMLVANCDKDNDFLANDASERYKEQVMAGVRKTDSLFAKTVGSDSENSSENGHRGVFSENVQHSSQTREQCSSFNCDYQTVVEDSNSANFFSIVPTDATETQFMDVDEGDKNTVPEQWSVISGADALQEQTSSRKENDVINVAFLHSAASTQINSEKVNAENDQGMENSESVFLPLSSTPNVELLSGESRENIFSQSFSPISEKQSNDSQSANNVDDHNLFDSGATFESGSVILGPSEDHTLDFFKGLKTTLGQEAFLSKGVGTERQIIDKTNKNYETYSAWSPDRPPNDVVYSIDTWDKFLENALQQQEKDTFDDVGFKVGSPAVIPDRGSEAASSVNILGSSFDEKSGTEVPMALQKLASTTSSISIVPNSQGSITSRGKDVAEVLNETETSTADSQDSNYSSGNMTPDSLCASYNLADDGSSQNVETSAESKIASDSNATDSSIQIKQISEDIFTPEKSNMLLKSCMYETAIEDEFDASNSDYKTALTLNSGCDDKDDELKATYVVGFSNEDDVTSNSLGADSIQEAMITLGREDIVTFNADSSTAGTSPVLNAENGNLVHIKDLDHFGEAPESSVKEITFESSISLTNTGDSVVNVDVGTGNNDNNNSVLDVGTGYNSVSDVGTGYNSVPDVVTVNISVPPPDGNFATQTDRKEVNVAGNHGFENFTIEQTHIDTGNAYVEETNKDVPVPEKVFTSHSIPETYHPVVLDSGENVNKCDETYTIPPINVESSNENYHHESQLNLPFINVITATPYNSGRNSPTDLHPDKEAAVDSCVGGDVCPTEISISVTEDYFEQKESVNVESVTDQSCESKDDVLQLSKTSVAEVNETFSKKQNSDMLANANLELFNGTDEIKKGFKNDIDSSLEITSSTELDFDKTYNVMSCTTEIDSASPVDLSSVCRDMKDVLKYEPSMFNVGVNDKFSNVIHETNSDSNREKHRGNAVNSIDLNLSWTGDKQQSLVASGEETASNELLDKSENLSASFKIIDNTRTQVEENSSLETSVPKNDFSTKNNSPKTVFSEFCVSSTNGNDNDNKLLQCMDTNAFDKLNEGLNSEHSYKGHDTFSDFISIGESSNLNTDCNNTSLSHNPKNQGEGNLLADLHSSFLLKDITNNESCLLKQNEILSESHRECDESLECSKKASEFPTDALEDSFHHTVTCDSKDAGPVNKPSMNMSLEVLNLQSKLSEEAIPQASCDLQEQCDSASTEDSVFDKFDFPQSDSSNMCHMNGNGCLLSLQNVSQFRGESGHDTLMKDCQCLPSDGNAIECNCLLQKNVSAADDKLYPDQSDVNSFQDFVLKNDNESEHLGMSLKQTPDDERSSDSGFRDKGSLSESCEDGFEKYNLEDIEAELDSIQCVCNQDPGRSDEECNTATDINLPEGLSNSVLSEQNSILNYNEETSINMPAVTSIRSECLGECNDPLGNVEGMEELPNSRSSSPDDFWSQQMASLQQAAGKTLALLHEATDISAAKDAEPWCENSQQNVMLAHSVSLKESDEVEIVEYVSPKSSSSGSSLKLDEGAGDSSYVSFSLDEEYVTAIRNELKEKLPLQEPLVTEPEEEEDDEYDISERADVSVHYNMYQAPLSPILEERESISSVATSENYSPAGKMNKEFFHARQFDFDSPIFVLTSTEASYQSANMEKFEQDIQAALENCFGDDNDNHDSLVIEDLDCADGQNNKQIISDTLQAEGEDILVVDTETNEVTLLESPKPKSYLAFVSEKLNEMTESPVSDFSAIEEESQEVQNCDGSSLQKSKFHDMIEREKMQRSAESVEKSPRSDSSECNTVTHTSNAVCTSPETVDEHSETLQISSDTPRSSDKVHESPAGIQVPAYTSYFMDSLKNPSPIHHLPSVPSSEPTYEEVEDISLGYECNEAAEIVSELENNGVLRKKSVDLNYADEIFNTTSENILSTIAENSEFPESENCESEFDRLFNLEPVTFDQLAEKCKVLINSSSNVASANELDGSGSLNSEHSKVSQDRSEGVCYTPDWESDSDGEGNDGNDSSSSGEFIWKDGEKEYHVKATNVTPTSNPSDLYEGLSEFPMDAIEEEEEEEEEEEDDDDGDDSIGSDSAVDFTPSAWNRDATPNRSSLRSPEKKYDQKKNVSFKKQKYHHVYEYPREASDSEGEVTESPTRKKWSVYQPQVDYASFADWELMEEEIGQGVGEIDMEADLGIKAEPEHFDFYKLSSVDFDFGNGGVNEDGEFFISSSARPFQFAGSAFSSQFFPGFGLDAMDDNGDTMDICDNEVDTSESMDSSISEVHNNQFVSGNHIEKSSGEETPQSPLSPTGLGELRHTRDKLKLDLPNKFNLKPKTEEPEVEDESLVKKAAAEQVKGEASLLDIEEEVIKNSGSKCLLESEKRTTVDELSESEA